MKPYEIIKIIENTAPPPAAAAWDHSGVQVAAVREEVTHVAVMLDPTLESIVQAVAAGADFILAHHPLSMQPRYPDRIDGYLSILSLLFTNGAWLYSAHTSLDANPEGPVSWLAGELRLQSREILEPNANPGANPGPGAPWYGFGFTGTFSEPLTYKDFCRTLAAVLGRDGWQVCGPVPERVRRVACCPGAGNSLLEAAVASGADVFITGDVKYHTALDARSANLRVLDVGHFILEEEMMRRFASQLAGEISVPVTFFPGRDPLAGERASLM